MTHYYLNDDHTFRPCSLMEWANQFETMDRHIGDDHVSDNAHVSTVWLGTNHNFFGGKPLLFETMIFSRGDEAWADQFQFRYSSWEQAKRGHELAVELIKQGFAES